MKYRYLVTVITAIAGLSVVNSTLAQSPLSGIKGAVKISKVAVKTDTVTTASGVEEYVSSLPSHRVRPEYIAPALVGIQQTFGVRDNEGNEYTRNGKDYFSLVPSVCFETAMGTVISGNVREPWRTDNEFMPHQGPFTAFLYESPRTVKLFGQTSGKNYEQLDASTYIQPLGNPEWDLWLYNNGYMAPAGRYFEVDTIGGVKSGVMVWIVMPDGNSSSDSIRLVSVDHKVSLAELSDMATPAVEPKLADGEIIIGGCFLVPRKDGAIRYLLAGIASRNNGNWYVYYPFAPQTEKEEAFKKEIDNEKPTLKNAPKDELEQLKHQNSNKQNKKESGISNAN